MADANYRVTWEFESLQQQTGNTASAEHSWTESWYGTFGGLEPALIEGSRIAAPGYLGTRLPWMDPMYRCSWITATNIANRRETKTVAPAANARGSGPKLDAAGGTIRPCQVNCCILTDFFSPPRDNGDKSHHRRSLNRGLSSDIIDGNIIKEDSTSFLRYLIWANYMGIVRSPSARVQQPNGPWRIAVQDFRSPAVQVTGLAITADTGGRRITLTAPLGNLTDGQHVNISGVSFPLRVNRVWTVIGDYPAGGPYQLGTSKKQLSGVWVNDGRAKAFKVSPVLVAPTQYTVIGLRDKKTGSRFKGTRGRRQAG